MAKTGAMGPLIGALFNSVTPPKQDKKRAKPSKGEASVTQPAQQHGELASYKEPKPLSDRQRVRSEAKYQKRNATEQWVAGRMSTVEHNSVHARADHVLAGRHPREFKGKSGERKGKW